MEQKTPLVSILVPCCNVEKYLHQCMDSILAQTYGNIEIICLNDGSKDNTLAILKEYESKDARVKVIDKPNTGYGSTMNLGIDKAEGKYVAIIESDDYIEPTMMETLVNAAEKENLDLARCLYIERNEVTGKDKIVHHSFRNLYGKVVKPLEHQEIFFLAPSIWVGMYNREFINRNSIRFLETPGASYQDTSFAFKVYAAAERVMFIPEVLHNYRINSNSSVNSPGKMYYVCTEDEEIRRYARQLGVYDCLAGTMARRTFGSYLWNYNRMGTMKLKREFMKKWSEDTARMFRDGEISRKDMKRHRYRRLWMIAHCPWYYYFTRKIW